MKLTTEDMRLLEELCQQHAVSTGKVMNLMSTVREWTYSLVGRFFSVTSC